jgi:hypothetical protein
MEPIESEQEYAARVPSYEANPRKRFNWLHVITVLGAIWLLFLLVSIIFQLPISGFVGPVMSIMLLLFFVVAGLLFWAMAPKANRE